jgi:hypothetical protein
MDGMEINIYDTAVLIDGHVDNVFSKDIPFNECYTLPTILDGGYTLTPGTTYVIDLKARVLFNPSGPNVDSNAAAQYETYYTFNPKFLPDPLPLPLYLPTIDSNGVYNFNLTVQPSTTYYIDPNVATGFVYTIGAGNPNFATVVLPTLQGSEPYTITWDNGLHTEQVLGGNIFNFLQTDPPGVSTFTVRGIDPADGLDPTSGTEFVTALTFVAILSAPSQPRDRAFLMTVYACGLRVAA